MLTKGQRQALGELRAVSQATSGALSVEATVEKITESSGPDRTLLAVRFTIDCSTLREPLPGEREDGRQEFVVLVPPGFPFEMPEVHSAHQRFAGLPYIVWSDGICLHASRSDWDPGRGMWGLVDRLVDWLGRAASGTLTGPAVPWHPPVTDSYSDAPPLVVGQDLPTRLGSSATVTTLWAEIQPVGRHHEVIAWHSVLPPGGSRYRDGYLAPLLVLAKPSGFQYPSRAGHLAALLEHHGLATGSLESLLRSAFRVNGGRIDRSVFMIGSPASTGPAATARIAHFAVWDLLWSVSSDGAVPFDAPVSWVYVYDQRPSIVVRRDTRRPVQWLRGKRVLVLGCGALGAPIAEHCVRAGATAVHVIDKGAVTPGILVRQPYDYGDIGAAKAERTAVRLRRISPSTTVVPSIRDAAQLGTEDLAQADLILDATASRAVAVRLEWLRRELDPRPPLVSFAVGHRCERALATVALPTSSGGGMDILRQLAVTALTDDDLVDVLDDFYPSVPRDVFQPEPGCSDPTFVGSSVDLAYFAGALLDAAVDIVSTSERAAPANGDRPSAHRAAVVVRHPSAGAGRQTDVRFWGSDTSRVDETTGYEIRLDPMAVRSMREECLRASELDRGRREAGGVLLGQVDMACRVVWISRAVPAPTDDASVHHVRIEIDRIRDGLHATARWSRGVIGFVGTWHSHPESVAFPSGTDVETMERAVNEAATTTVAAIVVLGGQADIWDAWLGGIRLPDIYARMFFAT